MKNETRLPLKSLVRSGVLILLFQGVLVGMTTSHAEAVVRTGRSDAFVALMADITIKGEVTDVNNEPLPGVTITVQATSTGTVTDVLGAYSLVAPEDGTLVFTYIGFKTQTIAVGNRNVINVVMEEDISNLDGFVVTSFGVPREQRSLGYASTTVRSEELVKVATPNLATVFMARPREYGSKPVREAQHPR